MAAAVEAGHAVELAVTGLSAGYGDTGPGASGNGASGRGAAVLADVAFSLPAGRRLSIVGASGCGKSTLLNVLAGLLPPAAGAVEVDGRRVAAADLDGTGRPGCRSGHAAYMFQKDLLLPWRTVLGNATLAAEAGRPAGDGPAGRGRRAVRGAASARARAALAELGLGEVCDARPDELSGGMRQRAALARTLVASKGLVLLDEPFGSLDTLTRADMRRWLLEVMRAHPATWVLVTHDVREALLLGDVVTVLGGRPATLHGWVETGLDADVRLRLAAVEAGAPTAVRPVAAGTPGLPAAADAAPADLLAAEDRVRRLGAEVLALLHLGRDA